MCILLVKKHYFCSCCETEVTPLDAWLLTAEDEKRHCRVTSFYPCAAAKSSQRLCPQPPGDLEAAPTAIVLVMLGDCNSDLCEHRLPRSTTDRFGRPYVPRSHRTVCAGAEEEMEEAVWCRERNRHLLEAVGLRQEHRGGDLSVDLPVARMGLVAQ